MTHRKTFYIEGMHCISCEVLVSQNLKKIDGVKIHSVCHKKGTIDVTLKSNQLEMQVNNAISDAGYSAANTATEEVKKGNSIQDYFQIATIALSLIFVISLLKDFQINSYFPEVGDTASVGVALLLGLIASVSTCLALVGGIVISFGTSYEIDSTPGHNLFSHFRPHAFFHVGRLGTFIVLGGLLGALGQFFSFSFSFTGYIPFIVAAVMFYIGLQILNIVPSITKLGFHMPRRFATKIEILQKTEHKAAPFLLGALTFFLPCGFTQSVQLASVASGGFVPGALTMGAFALGTMPVLLGLGIGSSYAKDLKATFFKKIIGVLIIFFALYSFNNGATLLGFDLSLSPTDTENIEITINEDGYQEIYMVADWGFEPNYFVVQKDTPVRWIIEGVNVSGCISEIIVPKLGISKELKAGENIIEFTPTESGELVFSCWMGMVGGKIVVSGQ